MFSVICVLGFSVIFSCLWCIANISLRLKYFAAIFRVRDYSLLRICQTWFFLANSQVVHLFSPVKIISVASVRLVLVKISPKNGRVVTKSQALEWPTYGTGLNPMENLWDILVLQVSVSSRQFHMCGSTKSGCWRPGNGSAIRSYKISSIVSLTRTYWRYNWMHDTR